MEQIPVTRNNTMFVEQISYVIKSAASPTQCNDIVPPRWNIAWCRYFAYPSIWDCVPPKGLLVEAVHIDNQGLLDLGLGQFQDSQGTRRAHLMETAELAN
jgi:hypothetical protein